MKPTDTTGLWAALERANTIPELQRAMWNIVKRIIADPMSRLLVDTVLWRCGTRLIFFEQGMTLVGLASPGAQEVFRARLVECGAFLEAMRLAVIMGRPLSRAEVVALGNHHIETLTTNEVEQFIVCALKTTGIQPLDLRRIYKQFGVDAVHLDII